MGRLHRNHKALNLVAALLLVLSGLRVAMPALHHHEATTDTHTHDTTTDHSHDDCLLCMWIHAIFDHETPDILTIIPSPFVRSIETAIVSMPIIDPSCGILLRAPPVI